MGELVIGSDEVRRHVADEYRGVFDDRMVDSFLDTYLGLELAEAQVDRVVGSAPTAARILDIGSGYGSFVLACRQLGLDAVGLEPQPFELRFARGRLEKARPQDEPEHVYVSGDGRALPFDDALFDVVTLWNVAEHVRELQVLLDEVARVLADGGVLLLLCPNYASVRREAHYQVPWVPMPRRVASWYLRRLGRASGFFDHDIHYRTPWEVTRAIRAAGLELRPPRPAKLDKLQDVDAISRTVVRRAVRLAVAFHLDRVLTGVVRALQRNPLRRTIDVVAVKQ